jgi:hypothetical protein
MFKQRIRAGVVGAIATCGVAGACMAPAVSQAQPIDGSGGAKGCAVFHVDTGTSETVPDGTLIISASGAIKKCSNGSWVTVPGRISPVGGPIVAGPIGGIGRM